MTTREFCKSELNKYVKKITGETGAIELYCADGADLFEERYVINVTGGKGSITASRPRALLLGVYDFLRRVGCGFLRPGDNGERIPRKPLGKLTAHAEVVPSARHRGITIEGSVSLENVLAIVDWAPKVGFNSYFIQFRTAFEFFDRWYGKRGEKFTEEKSAEFVRRIISEIKLRDMVYHAVGHGWTTACIGVQANGWKGAELALPDDKKGLLAETGGSRKFFNGIPLNTHLCYSNPEARKLMAEEVANYAQAHPEIDVLHFWLADDSNNVCECAECRKKRISDWYVMMLNEIDSLLSERNLSGKICFLVYLDLYWVPKSESIKNPDRFIMMFAPIFRTYTTPYSDVCNGKPLEYEYNKVKYPNDASTYLRFLRDWKNIFAGECFDFDYHLMWDINRDFGGERLAQVLFEDIRVLEKLGMQGYMSCQLQRAFYPNGLAFYLMGRALADSELSFDAIRNEYYEGAFGGAAEYASDFYKMLERTVSFKFMKEEESGDAALPGFYEAQKQIEKELARMPEPDDEICAESLAILRFAAENTLNIVNVLVLQLTGADENSVKKADEKRKKFFNDGELRFQPYVDDFYQNMIVDGIIAAKKVGIYA